jgi:hypothetical protein
MIGTNLKEGAFWSKKYSKVKLIQEVTNRFQLMSKSIQ